MKKIQETVKKSLMKAVKAETVKITFSQKLQRPRRGKMM